MDIQELTYPAFQANQVLTSAHLNDLFGYLDEQGRLTRANLIGIGIACGLEVTFEAPGKVHLSHGCGVTSEGYLIVERAGLTLAWARAYQLPTEYGYPPFLQSGIAPGRQFDLWELLPDNPRGDATALSSVPKLADKAVVVFLELRKDDLRSCGPTTCDDRGTMITATVRYLLIDIADLDTMLAAAPTPALLGGNLTERLGLPDLRMPRFDVPNTDPVATEEVLLGFQVAFRRTGLVAHTAKALTALYEAFQPLVADIFPNNPFADIPQWFGSLDSLPTTTTQVRFLPYYWDLFDDVLSCYDEARWLGVDLMCACCPPDDLFPRHLIAGVLDPPSHPSPYRHRFIASPAVGDCADRTHEFRTLFRRLVAVLNRFTENPPDKGIRATPSRRGEAPVGARAIPYYYDQGGVPPLYELWDPIKTARRRANQNLGYRADEYAPAPPDFVTDPLRYDLEPNDFFRIEGHLGKDVRRVLKSLLELKRSHRLPFEVIALRTGSFDEHSEIDLSTESCRFRDLEALYETLKAELICFLVKEVIYFYSLPWDKQIDKDPVAPSLGLLKTYQPDFIVGPLTLGRLIESVLTRKRGLPRPRGFPFPGMPDLPGQALVLVVAMSDLSALLTDDLRQVEFSALVERYRHVVDSARQMDQLRADGDFDQPNLSERLDEIVFRCRLDPFEALAEEYRRRLREAKQAQFLGHFLARHPGVQHKAGVPLGGTFILVYHQLPDPVRTPRDEIVLADRLAALDPSTRVQFDELLARLPYRDTLAADPDIQLLYTTLTGKVLVPRIPVPGDADRIYHAAVAELAAGTVIADFFLPYAYCSDCPPIEYHLPNPPLQAQTTTACTNTDGFAEVTVTVKGASGPLSAQVDGGSFEAMDGPLLLRSGDHTILVRDSAGNTSTPLAIRIPAQLTFGPATRTVNRERRTYSFTLKFSGGTPPYAADPGTVDNATSTYTSPDVPLTNTVTVTLTDNAGCTRQETFEGEQPCDLPCEGNARRDGYRFWLPEPQPEFPIEKYHAKIHQVVITDPAGNPFDLAGEVQNIVGWDPNDPIESNDFAPMVEKWITEINRSIAARVGSDRWVRLDYLAPRAGTTGTLFVDRLECIGFTMEIRVVFGDRRSEVGTDLIILYDQEGTKVTDFRPQPPTDVRIPLYGQSTSNKCPPEEKQKPVCTRTELKMAIHKEVIQDAIVLVADVLTNDPTGDDGAPAFVWEVQDAIPALYVGGQAKVPRFDPAKPTSKQVWLTGFTKTGCTVTFEKAIDFGER